MRVLDIFHNLIINLIIYRKKLTKGMKVMKGHPETIRKINRRNIVEMVRQYAPLSRTDLARRVGLSLPSVSRIIDDLIAERIILETGKGRSSGGRKPTLLEFNPRYCFAFGVDVARETTLVLTDFSGTIVEHVTLPTSAAYGPQQVAEVVGRQIERIREKHDLPPERIVGVGIATPGFLFKATQAIEDSPFMGWEKSDVVNLFSSFLPYPVSIDNIARASAIAEVLYGWGREFGSFFYFYTDWGTGGGVVYRRRIVRGAHRACGEVGHITIDPQGILCYCGNRGCLEQYTSTVAILRMLRKKRGGEVNFDILLNGYAQRDEVTIAVLKQAGFFLGKGVANVINLLNPPAVVIGGELGRCFPEYVEEAMTSARENIFSLVAQDTPIVVSSLGKKEVVLAMAQSVLDHHLEKLI